MMSVCTSCCARAGVFVREDVIPEVPCGTPVTFEADEPPYFAHDATGVAQIGSSRSSAKCVPLDIASRSSVYLIRLIQVAYRALELDYLRARFKRNSSKKPRTSPSFAKERHTSPSSEEGAGSCAAVAVAQARFRLTTRSQIEFAWGDEKTNTRFELASGRLRPPSDCSGSVVETQSVTCVVWPVMSENSTSFATDIIAFSS